MQNRIIFTAALCLSGTLCAQGTSIPSGYEKNGFGNDGNRYCDTLGGHADQRCQVLNGDTLAAGTWKQLHFKRQAYTSNSSTARSWKQLDLQIGPHNYATGSTVFAGNFSATPTKLFSGSINFPAASRNYNATWGRFAAAGDMTIAFTQSYIHSGTTGTCVDFAFSGGALANGNAWTALDAYYTDGLYDNNSTKYNQAVTYIYGNTGAACYATGQTNYGYFVPWQRCYGVNDDSTTTNDNKMRLYWSATRLAMSVPAFGALSVGQPYLTPTAFLGSCQNLYMDLSGTYPWIILPFTTSGTGSYSSLSNAVLVNYNAAYTGVRFWTQAAYVDPTTGPQLSMGGSTWSSVQAPVTMHRMIQANDANSGNAAGTEVKTFLPILKVD